MTALLDLIPRPAGERPLEPAVAFDLVDQAVGSSGRCPISCICPDPGTLSCIGTGRSLSE